MEIREITENKEHYRELLLLADEQWNMVERYLYRGTLYVLTEENELRALCVVTNEGGGTLEIKNLAVSAATADLSSTLSVPTMPGNIKLCRSEPVKVRSPFPFTKPAASHVLTESKTFLPTITTIPSSSVASC